MATLPTPPVVSGGNGLLGHALEVRDDMMAAFARGFEEQGAIFTLKMPFGGRMVVLHSPDYAEAIFDDTDKRLNISKGLKSMVPIFGEVNTLAPPHIYQNQRPVLYESFKYKHMGRHIDTMHSEVARWLADLEDHGELTLSTEMVRVTQNVATTAFFGKTFRDQAGPVFWEQFQHLSNAIDFVLPYWLPIPKFRRRDKAKKIIRNLIKGIIEERRQHPDQHHDLLQTLLDTPQSDGSHLDASTAALMITSLALAGQETTSMQAAWTMIELMQNPAYMERVRQEVDTHLPPGTVITAEVLPKLEHIFWAVDETTRLHPSGEIIQRVVDEDLELGGYLIPKGWKLMAPGRNIQRMPELFTDPERFDPFRFAPGLEEHKRHPFAIMGFGGKSHKCAGMNFARNEITTIVALMVQQYHWELLSKPERLVTAGIPGVTESQVRYKRRTPQDAPAATPAAAYPEEVIAACPHLAERAAREAAATT